ncbi:MAG: DUF3667 domain-containing protein [Gemmatimonadaceae bacterium]
MDYSTRHLVTEAFHELANVDGRLWRSVVALLSKPGFLTVEYFAGRRGRYMRPFSLFVLLNVAFFFVQPYTGLLRYTYEMYTGSNDGLAAMAKAKQESMGLSPAAFAQRMDDELRDEKKSLLLVAVPLFAAVLLLLYAGSKRVYVEHLVFSVHAYAYILFYFTAFSTFAWWLLAMLYRAAPLARPTLRFLSGESGILLTLCVGIVPYLTLGLQRFYGSSRVPAIARAFVLFFVFQALILVFRGVLFHTALHLV